MFIKIKTLPEKISCARFFDAPHKRFFWGAICFLLGIFVASVDFGILMFPFLASAFVFFIFISFFFKKRGFLFISFLLFLVFFGATYYGVYAIWSGRTIISFGEGARVSGVVCDDVRRKQSTQEMRVCLSEPEKGTVLIKTKRFPEFRYGDEILLRGTVMHVPEDEYGVFLRKEGIDATMGYPDIEIVSVGNGSFVKKTLFSIKRSMFSTIERMLSYDQAAFLEGILFGETGSFSSEFKDAMRVSGTTHLVALSGYNITILAFSVVLIFSYFLTPRAAMVAATVFILCFVLMTGAMPSVVRAGVMGILLLFAKQFGKKRDVKNVLLFSAVIMTMFNPRVLVFDVGFQLSFLAFMGIVYVQPALQRFFKIEDKGFLSWKDSFFSTLAAQIMVIPILLSQFGTVSFVSVPANIVILGFMPFTMGLGFITLFLSMASKIFAVFPGGVLEFLLQCEIGIINIFGKLGGTFSFNPGAMFSVVYYLILFLMLYGIPRIYSNLFCKKA